MSLPRIEDMSLSLLVVAEDVAHERLVEARRRGAARTRTGSPSAGGATATRSSESRADVREAVERGDLKADSWRMIVARDAWDAPVRTVQEVRELRDVAVVSNPRRCSRWSSWSRRRWSS